MSDGPLEVHILLPPLGQPDIDMIGAVLHNMHATGHVLAGSYGMVLILEGESRGEIEKILGEIVRQIAKCIMCGGNITWQGLEWKHVDPEQCRLDDTIFKYVPGPDWKGEGAIVEVKIPRLGRFKNVIGSHDKSNLVSRMRAIGRALQEGFGEDWLSNRDGEVSGYGSNPRS